MGRPPMDRTESRRPPVLEREPYAGGLTDQEWRKKFWIGVPGGYQCMEVTETVDMRNAGVGMVREALLKGWFIPEDPEAKRATPDGNSFMMFKPFDVWIKEKNENDNLARSMEGFKGGLATNPHGEVKEIQLEEDRKPLEGLRAEVEAANHNG